MPTDLAELARSILRQPQSGVIRYPHPYDSRYDYEVCGVCNGNCFGPYGMGNCAGCGGKGLILVEKAPSP